MHVYVCVRVVCYRPGHCVGRLVAPLWRVDLNANFRRPQWISKKKITVTIIELQSLPLEVTSILTPELIISTIYMSILLFVIRRKISPCHLNKEAIQKLSHKCVT